MGFIRPATPGFLVTLVAAILLAVVSFCVPYFKSVYFLKASINLPNNDTGSITFGTLGYCLELANGTTCSKPSIGYQLDINSLVGNKLPVEIPQVAVKWITYALFLHVVALILATGSAAFGLLAHVREMSMTCCSTCVSGIAAAVALLAFIFDLVLFFVAKARINAIGSASIGNAIWLTLAAWILLFFSGCFYTLGRCCVSRRPRNTRDAEWAGKGKDGPPPKNDYAEQMRLDAVKAEADRKARQKQGEVGLPAFSETQPLTARVEGDHVYLDDQDHDASSNLHSVSSASSARKPSQNTLKSSTSGPTYAAGGYVRGAAGTTAMDEYYHPTTPAPNTYPPQPQRQGSAHSYGPTAAYSAAPYAGASGRQASGYQPSSAPPAAAGYYQSTSPPPASSQTLGVPGQYNDPYAAYGHTQGGSSYHTASAHSQQASAVGYSQYDYDQSQQQAYSSPPQQTQYYSPQPYPTEHPAFLSSGMNTSSSPPPMQGAGYAPTALATGYSPAQHSQSPPQGYNYPERQYTLSGDGYGTSSVPPLQDNSGSFDPYSAYGSNAAPINTSTGYGGSVAMVGGSPSPVGGPRAQPLPAGSYGGHEELPPPGYDQGGSAVVGRWGKQ